MQKIEWLTRGNIGMPAVDTAFLEKWLSEVAGSHNRVMGRVTYIFCDDPTILDVNVQFLGHDYFTDIITFDYCRGRMLSGDIFISLDTVRSNALSLGVDYDNELHRVIAHGLLHLCGINDKGPGERAIMEACEDNALKLLAVK